MGQQTTKVEQWGLGKLVVKQVDLIWTHPPPFTTPYIALQVTEEGCGELCDPCANWGHCDICHHTHTKEEEEEV